VEITSFSESMSAEEDDLPKQLWWGNPYRRYSKFTAFSHHMTYRSLGAKPQDPAQYKVRVLSLLSSCHSTGEMRKLPNSGDTRGGLDEKKSLP